MANEQLPGATMAAAPPATNWPTYFRPADPSLSFAESGIKEQTQAIPGDYWLTPNGKVWFSLGDHKAFADNFLGDMDAAYAVGCVRTAYQAKTLAMTAKNAAAFDLSPLELMAHNSDVLMIVAESHPPAKRARFYAEEFVASFDTLVEHILKQWSPAPIDPRYKWSYVHHITSGADRSKVIEEPLTVDHLTITFHENLFDYYLAVPNMEGWYVTEIGGMKVGFGSKYQLKKFLLKIKTEFFTDGNLPGSNVRVAPIPKIEEPLVRRMGAFGDSFRHDPEFIRKRDEKFKARKQVWDSIIDRIIRLGPGERIKLSDLVEGDMPKYAPIMLRKKLHERGITNMFVGDPTNPLLDNPEEGGFTSKPQDRWVVMNTDRGPVPAEEMIGEVKTTIPAATAQANRDRMQELIADMEVLSPDDPKRPAMEKEIAKLRNISAGWHFSASVPIKENNLPVEVKRRLERGSVTEDVWEISEGDENSRGQMEVKPTGPAL